MTNKTNFWNRIAPKYAARPVSDQASYEYKLKLTQALFDTDMTVLEVGCGTGSTALEHAKHVQKIVATDFSSGMIEIAESKRVKRAVDNIEFRCESVGDIAGHSDAYDVVMAHSVLHLLEDLDEALKLMFDALKPGGYLVSSTACINDMLWFFRFIAPIGHFLRLIPYVSCFDRRTLETAMVNAGFELEEIWQPNKKAALFVIARKPVTE